MRSSLRRFHSLRELAQLARFISRAPDTHAFQQLDVAQAALVAGWRALLQSGQILPFDAVGFQAYSENEEDGILLYIFTVAGTTNKTVVEISSQDGRICMASNLIIHHRWCGFLFDGDSSFVTNGRRFFGRHPATRSFPPTFEARWFDRDNINSMLTELNVPSEIDLLSLDVDGNDLYLWEALSVTRPRVLVCEFNNIVPSDRSVTIPYRPDFRWEKLPAKHQFFRSASLLAFTRVSRTKGYRLVGWNALGYNAFFLRDDVAPGIFPTRAPDELEGNPFAMAMRKMHWKNIAQLPWVEI
jgi:hypothetical protein